MSSQLNCLISVSPNKMTFYAPYDRSQKRLITIMNPTAYLLFYKIRTNTQSIYNASPNCGVIRPYDLSEVNVSLNYFDFHRDQEYCHYFCVQYIRAPPAEQMQNRSILCIFKEIRRSDILNVRVPVELQPEAIHISKKELDIVLQHDIQKLIWNTRPIGDVYMDHLNEVTLPPKQKKCCRWPRFVMTMLIIMSGLAGGKLKSQMTLVESDDLKNQIIQANKILFTSFNFSVFRAISIHFV